MSRVLPPLSYTASFRDVEVSTVTNLYFPRLIGMTRKRSAITRAMATVVSKLGKGWLFSAVMYLALMTEYTFQNCDLNRGCIYMRHPFMHNKK
jgi:hypothetical protein